MLNENLIMSTKLTELWRTGYLALFLPLAAKHFVSPEKLKLFSNPPRVEEEKAAMRKSQKLGVGQSDNENHPIVTSHMYDLHHVKKLTFPNLWKTLQTTDTH